MHLLKKNHKITLFFWDFQEYEFSAYIVSKESLEYKEWRGHWSDLYEIISSFLKERTLNIKSNTACCDNNCKRDVFIVFEINVVCWLLSLMVTHTQAFHCVGTGFFQLWFLYVWKSQFSKNKLTKEIAVQHMKIPNILSQLERAPVIFLALYSPHTLNYPYGEKRMQMNDWQGFLTWASLFGPSKSPWERSLKQLPFTLCSELLWPVAKVYEIHRMMLVFHSSGMFLLHQTYSKHENLTSRT